METALPREKAENPDRFGLYVPDVTDTNPVSALKMAKMIMASPTDEALDMVCSLISMLGETQKKLLLEERAKLAEKRQKEEQTKAAQTDSMTGLANRQGFYKRCAQEFNRISRGESKGSLILSFDVNHLKWVNDTIGHAGGDKLLRTFAKAIENSIRTTDIAARFGGDEFIVCLNNISGDKKEKLLAQIDQKMSGVTFDFNDLKGLPAKGMYGVCYVDHIDGDADIKHEIERVLNIADLDLTKKKSERPPTRGKAPEGFEHLKAA